MLGNTKKWVLLSIILINMLYGGNKMNNVNNNSNLVVAYLGAAGSYEQLTPEGLAAYNWLEKNKKIKTLFISFSDLNEQTLNEKNIDVIWWHYNEAVSLPPAALKKNTIKLIHTFVSSGGGLFLSGLAPQYVVQLGVEKNLPTITRINKTKSSWWGFSQMVDGHPIFSNMGPQIVTLARNLEVNSLECWWDEEKTSLKQNRNFNGEWLCDFKDSESKVVGGEYSLSEGKIVILSTGAFTWYVDQKINYSHNFFRDNLELFTSNILYYLGKKKIPEPYGDIPDDQAKITIHSGRKIGSIDPWLYGHFLEPINNSIDGGLYAEMLLERSFEYSELVSRIWELNQDLDDVGEEISMSPRAKEIRSWGEGEGSIFRSAVVGDEGRIFIGDSDWKDYTIELKARKLEELSETISHTPLMDGFRIIFRAKDNKNFFWWNVGGWKNTAHALELVRLPYEFLSIAPHNFDNRTLLDKQPGSVNTNRYQYKWNGRVYEREDISNAYQNGGKSSVQKEYDNWHDIKVIVNGAKIECFMDGNKIHDIDDTTFAQGKIGLDSFASRCEFRDVIVRDKKGEILYKSNFSKKSLPYYNDEPPAMMWLRSGRTNKHVSISRTTWKPYNSNNCLKITVNKKLKNIVGIRQLNVPARKNVELDGYIYLRSNTNTAGKIIVGLRSTKTGAIYAEHEISNITTDWERYPFRLKPENSDPDAEFFIVTRDRGTYYLDQVSLMPMKNRTGLPFRDDILEAVRNLKPTIIRWPGGCFATHYNWLDGIGTVDQRPVRPAFDWHGMGGSEPNTLGTDEYILFCRELDAEPFIVLNVGVGHSVLRHNDGIEKELGYFIDHALNWIEYCNGPADSEWGSLRAVNGYPEPYNVKVWGIDNELWGDWYAQVAAKFCDAIRDKYPDLMLVAVGSNPAGIWSFGSRLSFQDPLTPKVMDVIKSRADFMSSHNYFGGTFNDLVSHTVDHSRWFAEQKAIYDKYSKGRDTKIALDEWNGGEAELRSGIAGASYLNCLEKNSDKVGMAAPALWFRHETLHPRYSWYNALIHHDHNTWFGSGLYHVMSLWSQHFAPDLIKSDLVCGSYIWFNREENNWSQPVPYLDIIATEDQDENRIVLKVINRSEENDINAELVINGEGFSLFPVVDVFLINHDNLEESNTIKEPERIKVKKISIKTNMNSISYVFPKHSAVLVEFRYNNK